ncbi:MAG: hypothetical protein AAFX78_09790 [Cyanobacteria bacterium J06638_20]
MGGIVASFAIALSCDRPPLRLPSLDSFRDGCFAERQSVGTAPLHQTLQPTLEF